MAEGNPNRLKAAGPTDPANRFPKWFEDGVGLKLELVTNADPRAPAIGELDRPADPVAFPGNFPDESFYFMAEARLEVGGAGIIGRARVIMALEAAFGGDGSPVDGLGVVFARLRVRIDDVIPGAVYVVHHPYGTTKELEADEGGRVAYTCDLGVAEGNMARVLVTGEIAPFLKWRAGAPAGYIGDGISERPVIGGPFRNHVEIVGPRIGQGSANAAGTDRVRTDLFTVQGRIAGTGANAPTPPLIGVPPLTILDAEYRTSRAQYRVRGEINPVSIPKPGGFASDRVDITVGGEAIGSAFPDATGAWALHKTLPGSTPPAPGVLATVRVTTASGKSAERLLIVRN
jgi:hypothetical protein